MCITDRHLLLLFCSQVWSIDSDLDSAMCSCEHTVSACTAKEAAAPGSSCAQWGSSSDRLSWHPLGDVLALPGGVAVKLLARSNWEVSWSAYCALCACTLQYVVQFVAVIQRLLEVCRLTDTAASLVCECYCCCCSCCCYCRLATSLAQRMAATWPLSVLQRGLMRGVTY
jgi:hypothetical protein